MPRFGRSLTISNLHEAMRDERYYNQYHPEHKNFQSMVTRGFEALFKGKMPTDATGRAIDTDANADQNDAGSKSNEGGGLVYVSEYTQVRNEEDVDISAHVRSSPPRRERESDDKEPKKKRSDGTSGRHSASPKGDRGRQPDPSSKAKLDAWPASPFSKQFRDELHNRESPTADYRAVHPRSNALGRYQLTLGALQAAKMKNADGQWTGKYGIHSDSEFLNSPVAQEKVFSDFMVKTKNQMELKGSYGRIGQVVNGIRGQFVVTEGGLLAAGHRSGAENVKIYFSILEAAGGDSTRVVLPQGAGLAPKGPMTMETYTAIETRLREFMTIHPWSN